jgi:hypothetical protein
MSQGGCLDLVDNMTEFLIGQALCLSISGSISFHLNYYIIQTGQFKDIWRFVAFGQ